MTVIPVRQHYKEGIESHCYNLVQILIGNSSHSFSHHPCCIKLVSVKSITLRQSVKSSEELAGHLTNPTNNQDLEAGIHTDLIVLNSTL